MQRRKQDAIRKAWRPTWLVAGIALNLAIVAGCGVAGNDNGSVESLSRRLQRIEDRAEVQQLITSAYTKADDARDAKAIALLFIEDGELKMFNTELPPKEYKGRAALENMFSAPTPSGNTPAPPLRDVPASLKHMVTNPHIQMNGDHATATTYWQAVTIGKDGQVGIRSTGYYRDTLQRDQGYWRFKSREVFNYDMPVVAAQDASTSTSASVSR